MSGSNATLLSCATLMPALVAVVIGSCGALAGCTASHPAAPPCAAGERIRCECASLTIGAASCVDGAFEPCVCAEPGAPCIDGSRAPCSCSDGAAGSEECLGGGYYGACECDRPWLMTRACTPGERAACFCEGSGRIGAQVCRDDATYAACECATIPPSCEHGAVVACSCPGGVISTQTCEAGSFGPCACGATDGGVGPRDAGPRDAGPVDGGMPDASTECGTCGELGVRCGNAIDSCGGVLSCGPCTATVRSLTIDARDMAYDPVRDVVYASVGSAEGVRGNSVVAIDPVTARVVWSTFVGSDPESIALTRDGSRLWVALAGSGSMRAVDVATHVAGPEIPLGSGAEPYRPFALATLDDGAVAVVGEGSPADRDPMVYDEGVRRGATTSFSWIPYRLVGIGSDVLVGYDGGGGTGYRYEVGPAGLESGQRYFDLFAAASVDRITFDGEYVIGGTGDAVDPTTMTRVGQCRPTGLDSWDALPASVGSADTNRIYVAVGGAVGLHGITSIVACDRTTFTEVGRVALSGIESNATLMAIRPDVGLAMFLPADRDVPGGIVFVDTNLIAQAR